MKLLYPLLVVLLAVFAVAPLAYPGAFQSYTGLSAVYNLIQLHQNPLQFFTWAPTFGRPFDLFRTDGILPYLLAEIAHLAGFGYLDSVKLIYALAWIGSGLALFALARRWLAEAGALLAAAVYVYLPFHIATVYVAGAFAESLAWALFPLALLPILGADSPKVQIPPQNLPRWNNTYRLLPFAALYLTQPGLAVLFSAFAFCVAVALRWRERDWVRALIPILGGLAIGAILALPSIITHGPAVLRDGFSRDYIQLYQLFSPSWNWGMDTTALSQKGVSIDLFPFQIGVIPIGLAIAAIALSGSHPGSRIRSLLFAFCGAAIVVSLLALEISAPIWNLFGALLTHPWQVLVFVGLGLTLVAGSLVEFDARLTQPAMVAFLVALPVLASYSYLSPAFVDFAPRRPQIATFNNDEVALLDYRIVGPLRHGATVRVQMQWQALRQIDHDYTVFVHAVDEQGKTWASEDSKPQDGTLPMVKWLPGQVVADIHTIQIDLDGPREGYHLEVGLYQAANGERPATDSGADQLILPRPGDPPPTISDQLPDTSDNEAY